MNFSDVGTAQPGRTVSLPLLIYLYTL